MYLTAGTLAGIVLSFTTPRISPEKLDYFFRLMRTPVRLGEVVSNPCTLPEDPQPPIPKWFNHPDIELPRPTRVDVVGFLISWCMVGLIIAGVIWLAS